MQKWLKLLKFFSVVFLANKRMFQAKLQNVWVLDYVAMSLPIQTKDTGLDISLNVLDMNCLPKEVIDTKLLLFIGFVGW